MMKKKIIVANWKMNYDLHETTFFLRNFLKYIKEKKICHNKEIIIAPSFPFLHISNQISQGTLLKIAAQNIFFKDKGSFTGEISASMLKSIGIDIVIIGHSERRKFFLEDENSLLKKLKIAIKHKIKVIFCIGETYEDRNKNNQYSIIEKQLNNTIFHCSPNEIKLIYIAYEPIWAIGTGVTATIDQITKMHYFIRNIFYEKYGNTISSKISILYGGSINHLNAKNIIYSNNVDGGLIGNSSLNLEQFVKIVQY
ncbi:triose-phosphate isomerase [Blattabacterium cuenoti]|uniref:triose-phosphate isomerase n=1 Tax=Blattabacterium cuenoti TaxID=1653831 RepID=UPI00293C00DC|nr:triose-phosphate isomerase [Blattabacterium cuenoti]